MTALLEPDTAEIGIDRVLIVASTRPEALAGDGDLDVAALRARLQRAMTAGAGVVRSAAGVQGALETVEAIDASLRAHGQLTADAVELCNLLTVARGLLAAAARRTESRGNHSRAEFTLPDPAWRRRQVLIEESA